MPATRRRTYAPGVVTRLAVGAMVAGAQVALLASMGFVTVRPNALEGGAPVINLMLQPVPRFDSERAPSVESEVQAKAAAAAPGPRQPRLRLRTIQSDAPALALPTVTEASPNREGADSRITSPAVVAGVSGASNPASAPGATPGAAPGATQGGGARAIGAAAAPQQDVYAAQVLAWIERHKRHPGGLRGVVTVQFQLDRQGRVHDLRLARSSGVRALDRAALDQIAAAQPFPRPPADAPWRMRAFTFNIDYRTAETR